MPGVKDFVTDAVRPPQHLLTSGHSVLSVSPLPNVSTYISGPTRATPHQHPVGGGDNSDLWVGHELPEALPPGPPG